MMCSKKWITWAIFIGFAPAFAASAAEKAESKSEAKMESMVSNLKSACKEDLNKYCSDITPGGGRIAACLESREDKLSGKCKTEWIGTKARLSEAMDKTEVAFRKSCGYDVNRFCSNVPSGRGRLLECLSDHQDQLSDSCQKFGAALDQKLSSALG